MTAIRNTRFLKTALRQDSAFAAASIGVLVALAVACTAAGVGMQMSAGRMTFMADLTAMESARSAGWAVAHGALVFLMWWAMMTAMMLPSAAPAVLLYAALLRRSGNARRPDAAAFAFMAGYVLAWAGFSMAATAAQLGLEAAGVLLSSTMRLESEAAAAALMIGAGAYQFLPLKKRCLDRCRSPLEVIARHHREGIPGAARLGLLHGTYCMGCCFALMLVLFAGGVMNLFWIVGLAAAVAMEKLFKRGPLFARVLGGGLAIVGAIELVVA